MDLPTIISGLLHDTIEDTEISKEDLKKTFGEDIAVLVERVSKLSVYRNGIYFVIKWNVEISTRTIH